MRAGGEVVVEEEEGGFVDGGGVWRGESWAEGVRSCWLGDCGCVMA